MPRYARTPDSPAIGGAPTTMACSDPTGPLLNLAAVGRKVDSVRRFLSDSISRGAIIDPDHLRLVSSEISSSLHQIIINGAALIASSPHLTPRFGSTIPKHERSEVMASGTQDPTAGDGEEEATEDADADFEIMEIDAAQLMEERVHFCEICGKGFKRDANLRMHMRSHGNEFKTLEALSRPSGQHHQLQQQQLQQLASSKKVRFSCPFVGCNRNRAHNRFRPLKSVVCVKNHFKRSHGPKTYMCTRCNKKSFSVVTDLKSHLKHCGECRWKCSCGTTFSRKEKLFGHLALFEGHIPVVGSGAEEANEGLVDEMAQGHGQLVSRDTVDHDLFDKLMDGFEGMEDGLLSTDSQQDLLSVVQRAWKN